MADETVTKMLASGLTQVELARRLGVSQGHLSKVLKGVVAPGGKVRKAVAERLSDIDPEPSRDEWLRRVAEAADNSSEFRRLVVAALRLME